jgi:hypothetical protein
VKPVTRGAALAMTLGLAGWTPPAATQPGASQLPSVVQWMIGSFTTDAQADADEAQGTVAPHPRRRLVSTLLTPRTERADGFFLYVEQAELNRLHRPTSQRVLQLVREKTVWRLHFWALDRPERFVGAHSSAGLRDEVAGASMRRVAGCELVLAPRGDTYAGRMPPGRCTGLERPGVFRAVDLVVSADGWRVDEREVDRLGRDLASARPAADDYRRQPPLRPPGD